MSAVIYDKILSSSVLEQEVRTIASHTDIVGGVVLVISNGTVLCEAAFGHRDLEAPRAMNIDDIFYLSSLAKPIVAASTLALVERGVINLDGDIREWLPNFEPRLPDGSIPAITVRDLLTHTSGLRYRFLEPEDSEYHTLSIPDGLADKGIALQDALEMIGRTTLCNPPGSQWAYSVATDVLGAVLQASSGQSLATCVSRYITTPLGLKTIEFLMPPADRLAIPYHPGASHRRLMDGDVVDFGANAKIVFCPSRPTDPRSFPSGGAGMFGSAPDFAKFLEAIRNGGADILSPESTRLLMENQIGDLRVNLEQTPAWGFGFGGAVLMDATIAQLPQNDGTWKWGGVYGHHWYVDPSKKLTVVAMTNTAIVGMVGEFPTQIMRAIYSYI